MHAPRKPFPLSIKRRIPGLILLAVFCLLLIVLPVTAKDSGYTSLSQLNGKRIGVQTGSIYDAVVSETLPDARFVYFNSASDLVAALTSDKIDGFPGDEPPLRLIAAEDGRIMLLDEAMDTCDFGAVMAKNEKGEQLCREFNDWLSGFTESGGLDRLRAKWIDGPEEEKTVPDAASFPAPKGVLKMATEGGYAPMNYYSGEKLVGFEVDLACRFCEDRGYGLEVIGMNFDGVLPAVESGKADFAMAGISITKERMESVNFSDPYYVCRTLMAVHDLSADGRNGFWSGIVSSFEKTFLREDRWRLFAEGIATTMLITFLSVLLGTALGFAVFLLCRNGGAFANTAAGIATRLVLGMPMVVLLMILYYIIFGSVSISGILVSVIGFMLTFGASVFGLLKMGVGTVDRGQYEAAYALGHSEHMTFFRIILPQALPHILPAYSDEIVSLLKSTAIVGYIAVQDLTKMGDIVRSRTYEAFFPLIAVAAIYFILEDLFGLLIRSLKRRMDPKRRSREEILKGVKTDDQN